MQQSYTILQNNHHGQILHGQILQNTIIDQGLSQLSAKNLYPMLFQ